MCPVQRSHVATQGYLANKVRRFGNESHIAERLATGHTTPALDCWGGGRSHNLATGELKRFLGDTACEEGGHTPLMGWLSQYQKFRCCHHAKYHTPEMGCLSIIG